MNAISKTHKLYNCLLRHLGESNANEEPEKNKLLAR